MSDELPTGSVNLEDDGPAIEPPAPPAPVAVAPPTEPVAPPEPHEPEAVEVEGRAYVPVAAVIAERKQRQALTEKASRVDALEQEVAQSRPWVQFLKDNPDFMKPRATEAPVAPSVDPKVQQLAQVLDLYTADGQLDLNKASVIRSMMRDEANTAVQPYQELTMTERANQNIQRIAQVRDADGQSPSMESVQAVSRLMPAKDMADPQVASVMAALALGLDRMRSKAAVVAPPASVPLLSEPSGGMPRARPAMSKLEERIVAQRQTTPQAWTELTKNYQPGRPTVLEDD